MKKILLVLVLSLSVFCFAENSEAYYKVDLLLRGGLKNNTQEIKKAAAGLTPAERLELYEQHKMQPWIGAIVNIFVPFGVGNYIQGDNFGGTVTLVGDIAGIVMVNSGANVFVGDIRSHNARNNGASMMAGGVTVITFSTIYSWFRVFTYPNEYNSKLVKALNV